MPQPHQVIEGNTGHNERRCRNCASFITPEFARVFGNNDDEVFGCLDCMSATAVRNGHAHTQNADRSLK
ncbi:DUF7563 family protein [Haladaptatus sp. DFWS20]|uniref:DUF7563 family protein n=1 Tax=Haladaptatus sp. DFWS20 TaxID=3403467 RepID=UPI003EBDAB2A